MADADPMGSASATRLLRERLVGFVRVAKPTAALPGWSCAVRMRHDGRHAGNFHGELARIIVSSRSCLSPRFAPGPSPGTCSAGVRAH